MPATVTAPGALTTLVTRPSTPGGNGTAARGDRPWAGVARVGGLGVPAAGGVGEGMVAIVLAQAFLEKFGGDSLNELRRNYAGYLQQVKEF